MAKKDFSAALDTSLDAETKSVDARFSRADAYYGMKETKAATERRVPPAVKVKAIRDIFTMPPDDHALIEKLRKTCTRADLDATKSLIVRAGLHALNTMPEAELLELVAGLERLKPGRKS
jgi:hypothetical protein